MYYFRLGSCRTPPRRPKVDEADFVVEYVNDKAAAEAAARQQKAGPGAPVDAQVGSTRLMAGPTVGAA